MIWRTVLLIGAIGATTAAIGAPDPEPEGRSADAAMTPTLRVVAPATPLVASRATDPLRLHLNAPGTGVTSTTIPEVVAIAETLERPSGVRYRLFRPPDHAGPEYDDVYASDVDDPGAAGTVKLAQLVVIPAPFGSPERAKATRRDVCLDLPAALEARETLERSGREHAEARPVEGGDER